MSQTHVGNKMMIKKDAVMFYVGLAFLIMGYFALGFADNYHDMMFLSGVLFGIGIGISLIYGPRLFGAKIISGLKPSQDKPKIKKDKQPLKEKIIVVSVILVLFLPVRLLIYGYVSHDSYTSIGLVSVMGVSLIILAEKNKLGKFGQMWKRHIYELTHGTLAKMYLAATIFTIPFLAAHLVFLDQGSHQFYEDRQVVLSMIMVDAKPTPEDFKQKLLDSHIHLPSDTMQEYAKTLPAKQRAFIIIQYLQNPLFLMPFYMSIENEASQGWIQHLIVVSLVAECEGVCLFILYRKIYTKSKPKVRLGVLHDKCCESEKNIKPYLDVDGNPIENYLQCQECKRIHLQK